MLKDRLKKVGLDVDVAEEEPHELQARYGKGDYEAMFYGVDSGLTDPAFAEEMWMSTGLFHFWNPRQASPATPWEAAIDDAMRKQARTMDRTERHALFATAQRTLAEHVPILYFAAQKVSVATSARLHGAQPVVIKPPILWDAEELWVTGGK